MAEAIEKLLKSCAEFVTDDGRRFAWSESNVRYEEVSRDDASFTMLRNRLAALEGSVAAADVLAERRRQQEGERWSTQHDDTHVGGELAHAAACYAMKAGIGSLWMRDNGTTVEPANYATTPSPPAELWPWAPSWWKPKDRRRDLVRAAALLLAEIERLDRAKALAV